MSTAPEAFIPLNGSAGNSAPVTGGRRHRKHLKLVTRKQARKLLKKMGKKMRGGNPNEVGAVVTGGKIDPMTGEDDGTEGGRRRRKTRRHTKSRGKSLFGLKY
jgi:hypothetical protein